jgi:hypothetical protein
MSKLLSLFIAAAFAVITFSAGGDEVSVADAKPTISVRSAQRERMEFCHKESTPKRVELEAAIELCSEMDEAGNKVCSGVLLKQAELKAFVRSCLVQNRD